MISMAAYKTCKLCGRSFPMTKKYYNINSTSKDGFQSYCRSCQRKQEVKSAMDKMRKGSPKPKKPQIKKPKVPNFSEIFKARRSGK